MGFLEVLRHPRLGRTSQAQTISLRLLSLGIVERFGMRIGEVLWLLWLKCPGYTMKLLYEKYKTYS